MGYCSLDDVQNLTGLTFSSTSRPKTADVLGFIEDVAADLNGVAQAAGYDVPVTNLQAIAVLKKYNSFSAAVQAWHAGYTTSDEPPRVAYWREQYDAFIGRLRRGEQQLPGATTEEGVDDPAFGIAPATRRERYWLTGENL